VTITKESQLVMLFQRFLKAVCYLSSVNFCTVMI